MAGNVPYYIYRSLNTAIPGALANGQLAYSANGDVGYIGSNGAIVPVFGKRTPGTLTANQALVANATGYIDVVKTANLFIGSFSINIINATSNSTTLGASSNSELTTTWAIKNYVDLKTAGALAAGNGMTSNATTFGVNAGNNQLVSNSTGLWITQSNIDHNSLANYSANKHIDHTSVSITAGNGLTGGGDISSNRSLAVVAGDGSLVSNSTGVFVNTKDGLLANSTGLWAKAGTGVTVNSTGIHIGQAVGTTNSPTFQDMTLQGNLVINGSLVSINVATLAVNDSNIKLANGQTTVDSVDIGLYGVYGNSTVTKYAGLFRAASDGNFRLFKDVQSEPGATVNTAATGYTQATLIAAIQSNNVTITGGSIIGITDLAVADGGTGQSPVTLNSVLIGNDAGPITQISGTDGQVLISISGVPTFSVLDGGTF